MTVEEELGLLPVPFPDLAGLETAVIKQLKKVRDLISGISPRNNSAAAGETYGELGQVFHTYGFVESASACYHNASILDESNFRWPYLGGYVEQQEGRLETAALAFAQALKLQPKDVATLVRFANVEVGRGRLAAARALLEHALEVDPTVAAAQAALGELALMEGDYKEAVERLESVLVAVPAANRFHYPLGTAYRALGDVEKARHHFALRGEVGIQPPDPVVESLANLKRGERVHLLRGRRAFAAKHYGDAVAAFAEAVASAPESARARVNLAAALAHAGSPLAAIQELRRVLQFEPDNSTAHFNLGQLLAHNDSPAEALGHLRKAVSLDPDDAGARGELSKILRRGNLLSEALLHANAAVQLEPASEDARLAKVSVLVDMERLGDAITALEETLQQMPQSGRVSHVLARILAAGPDPALRDGHRALELALRVHKASATLEHTETVALALAAVGNCEQAFAWQSEVVRAAEQIAPQRLPELRATLARYEVGESCKGSSGT
jgi:tetratricopeptide (TPR) repeat protein